MMIIYIRIGNIDLNRIYNCYHIIYSLYYFFKKIYIFIPHFMLVGRVVDVTNISIYSYIYTESNVLKILIN